MSLSDKDSQYKKDNEMKKTLPGVKIFFRCFQEKENRETPRCICMKGSLTVEATVIIPIFVCFFAFLLFYFRIMQVQLVVQSVLEETGRSLAILSAEKAELEEAEYLAMAKGMMYLKLREHAVVENYVSGGALGVSLLTSDFKGDAVLLNANYKMTFPVKLVGNIGFFISQKTVFRKWTGWHVSSDDTAGMEIEKVYVSEYGEVYHLRKNCPYLDLSIQQILVDELEEARNSSGSKYKECTKCEKGEIEKQYVYITTYGDKYHAELECSGLKRTVFQKNRSEVGGMQACPKCS